MIPPRLLPALLLAASCALAQIQQLQLSAPSAGMVYEPGQAIDFGTVPTTAPATVTLQLTNNGPAGAVLTRVSVDGAVFQLGWAGRNPVGTTLPVGQSVEFTITFSPLTAGPAHLGQLWVQAAVLASSPEPTLQPQAEYDLVGVGAGPAILSPRVSATPTPTPTPAPVWPKAAVVAQPAVLSSGQQSRISIQFDSPLPAAGAGLLSMRFTGNGDAQRGFILPSGTLAPSQVSFTLAAGESTARFAGWPDIAFQSGATASTLTFTATLGDGTQLASQPFTVSPAWPNASIVATPAVLAGGEQVQISIHFDSPLPASGAGLLTLDFTGKGDTQRGFILPDPNGTFAPSQVSFTLAPGDTAARFEGAQSITFQTGTSASTLTFTARLGDGTALASQSFTIAQAPVSIDLVLLEFAAGSVLVTADGFDNTRTASQISFTFNDTSGHQIGQPILVDATTPFQSYFANAGTGLFGLKQAFSVVGNVSDIGSVAVTITNAAGTSAPVVAQ